MKLIISGRTNSIKKEFIEKVASAAFSYLNRKIGTIEFSFVTEIEIERLNTVYRGKRKVTDVLSFVLEDKPLLGQIFICYNFLRKQALSHNKSIEEELAHLLVHGILHCYGYDHESSDEEEKLMVEAEREILNKVGIKL